MHHESEDSFADEEIYPAKRKRTDMSEGSEAKAIPDLEVWSAQSVVS